MKKLFTTLSLLGLLATIMSAQSEIQFLNIFGEEDLTTTSDLLADNLRLCIEDDVSEVTKSQAITDLKAFLAKHSIVKKKILHNGKSTDADSSYKVARVKTESETYRVFAYSEKEGDSSKIKEIRIDKM